MSELPDVEEVGDGFVEELEDAFLREEVDVCGPSDEAVDVLGGVDVEVHVDPVHHLLADDAVHHFPLQLAAAVALLRKARPRRVPGHVAVLAARQQDDLLEVPQVSSLRQLEEERLARRLCVLHGELVERGHLVHLAHEPQSRLDLRVHPVEVPQVRRAEREEEAELAAELGQAGECGPRDYAAHAVPHKINDGFPGVFEVALDAEPDLVGEAQAHGGDVSVGVHFVGGGAVEERGGQHLADFALEHLHVEGTGLEAVAEEHHHVALVVGQLFPQLGLAQF